jgi:hypothetical protein
MEIGQIGTDRRTLLDPKRIVGDFHQRFGRGSTGFLPTAEFEAFLVAGQGRALDEVGEITHGAPPPRANVTLAPAKHYCR